MIARIRAVIDKNERNDAGFSLVELLVAITLFLLLIGMVAGLYANTMKTYTFTRSITTNARFAANAMNEAARVLRAGTDNPVAGQTLNDPAFVRVTDEDLIIYAYVNLSSSAELPVMIRLYLNSNRQLVESRWPATALANGWSFPDPSTPPASTRQLAATVAPPVSGGIPLFTYILADGSSFTPPATPTADQLRAIAAVKVTLTVQASLTDARNAVTLVNTVGLSNLNIPRVGS
jgi:prepilin-type N-terminal cleavage/methylation domain-containing protein